MIATRVAYLLLLVLPALGSCTEPPTPTAPSGPVWLVDVARDAGLDVVQIGGGDTVDWVIDSVGCGGAWLDYDGDGDADLYLAQGATDDRPRQGPPDRLFRNDGDPDGDGVPEFVDVTEAAGLGDTLWSFGVAGADYDNDGDTDLYLTNWGPNRLYRNNGDGTFTDVAEAGGVADTGWAVSAAWGDADRDGDLDLYVANYVDFDFERYPSRGEAFASGGPPFLWKDLEVYYGPRGQVPGRDVYFRNDGDPDGDGVPTFTDATREAGLVPFQHSYGLGARFFDADDDGDPDLYVANDSLANGYFVNRGDGTFEERSIISGLAYNEQGHEQAGMGIAAGDYDGDGLLDLIVTNFSHDHDTLYRNQGNGLFSDVSFSAGLGNATYLTLAWGVAFADLDHDGWEDLYVAHGHVYPQVDEANLATTFRQPNSVFRNRGDGRFDELTDRAGPGLRLVKSSRAVLPVDLEGDGDLDFAVTSFNDTPDLLRNDGAPGRWLQVRLEGTRSNREGIGARVSIEAGGRRQTREMTGGASIAGSVMPVVHFGLGEVALVDRLEVRWPAGGTTLEESIAADRLVVIREPAGG
jgi:hypothetical protein